MNRSTNYRRRPTTILCAPCNDRDSIGPNATDENRGRETDEYPRAMNELRLGLGRPLGAVRPAHAGPDDRFFDAPPPAPARATPKQKRKDFLKQASTVYA